MYNENLPTIENLLQAQHSIALAIYKGKMASADVEYLKAVLKTIPDILARLEKSWRQGFA
jgi:hypothetical protein